LEKSRLRRFFRTVAAFPPAKSVVFAGFAVPCPESRSSVRNDPVDDGAQRVWLRRLDEVMVEAGVHGIAPV
jgi:hypothetical protein